TRPRSRGDWQGRLLPAICRKLWQAKACPTKGSPRSGAAPRFVADRCFFSAAAIFFSSSPFPPPNHIFSKIPSPVNHLKFPASTHCSQSRPVPYTPQFGANTVTIIPINGKKSANSVDSLAFIGKTLL